MALRTGRYALRLVKQIARAKDREPGFGEQNAVWHVRFCQRRGQTLSGEVRSLVGIAFAAAGSASEAKRNAVFGEHVGQTLDLADTRNGEQHLVASPRELLGFLEHGGNRATETRRGVGQGSAPGLRIVIAVGAEVLDLRGGEGGDLSPEILCGRVQNLRSAEISYAAPFLGSL